MAFNIVYVTDAQKAKRDRWLVPGEVPWLCDNPTCGALLGISDPNRTLISMRYGKNYEVVFTHGAGAVVAHTCRRCKKMNVLGSD
jgi:hypothetical protein